MEAAGFLSHPSLSDPCSLGSFVALVYSSIRLFLTPEYSRPPTPSPLFPPAEDMEPLKRRNINLRVTLLLLLLLTPD